MFTLCMLWLQIKVGGWVTAGYETWWHRYDIYSSVIDRGCSSPVEICMVLMGGVDSRRSLFYLITKCFLLSVSGIKLVIVFVSIEIWLICSISVKPRLHIWPTYLILGGCGCECFNIPSKSDLRLTDSPLSHNLSTNTGWRGRESAVGEVFYLGINWRWC